VDVGRLRYRNIAVHPLHGEVPNQETHPGRPLMLVAFFFRAVLGEAFLACFSAQSVSKVRSPTWSAQV